jgi:hypothetical protein
MDPDETFETGRGKTQRSPTLILLLPDKPDSCRVERVRELYFVRTCARRKGSQDSGDLNREPSAELAIRLRFRNYYVFHLPHLAVVCAYSNIHLFRHFSHTNDFAHLAF